MDENELAISTYNKIARRYADSYSGDARDMPYVDQFLSRLSIGAKILDVGCGPGVLVRYISNKGYQCEGIDLSEEMIKIAHEKVPQGKFSLMDMRHLQYADEAFDGIVAVYALIHIPSVEISSTLGEFGRVLKKDGLLLIIAQQGEKDHIVNEPLGNGEKTFINFFTPERLSQALADTGLTVVVQERNETTDAHALTKSNTVIYTIARKEHESAGFKKSRAKPPAHTGTGKEWVVSSL
ncbi:MAG: class I SAM-dependent methyltransferase [bacterium]|nr:class I SAM-dependent methyltransferase [bacterium]MDZ4296229.1 class I SAM-dependent methyltransferase [Patescibacteria group bacterium]